jgi:hypothetical protein
VPLTLLHPDGHRLTVSAKPWTAHCALSTLWIACCCPFAAAAHLACTCIVCLEHRKEEAVSVRVHLVHQPRQHVAAVRLALHHHLQACDIWAQHTALVTLHADSAAMCCCQPACSSCCVLLAVHTDETQQHYCCPSAFLQIWHACDASCSTEPGKPSPCLRAAAAWHQPSQLRQQQQKPQQQQQQ